MWSKKNGDELKKIVTERFSSSTVFLSLLFSSELSILYSPSDPGKNIRSALESRSYDTPEYWTGVFICFAVRVTHVNCNGPLTYSTVLINNTFSCSDLFLCNRYVGNKLVECS